jgi:predicted RNA binding protein YcfA (HicA-like mRNA interferase family)
MPPKIRKLKANLSKAGFSVRPGKGSHTVWTNPTIPDTEVTISGHDGDDAQKYQIKQVQNALKRLERKQHE